MDCPKCRTRKLKRTPLSGDEVAMVCAQCHGFWLRSDQVGDWMVDAEAPEDSRFAPSELDLKGGLCPEGHGILSRVRIEREPAFYLDRCSRCGGVWFDRGEWDRLASLRLLQDLPELWSEAYQRRQFSESRRAAYLERVRATLGPDLFERLAGLAEELRDHEHRAEALAFLRNESSGAED